MKGQASEGVAAVYNRHARARISRGGERVYLPPYLATDSPSTTWDETNTSHALRAGSMPAGQAVLWISLGRPLPCAAPPPVVASTHRP